MNELAESHKNHLLPQEFDVDRTEEEQTVEILTEHITKMFQQAQIKIQRIGKDGTLTEQEKPIKKNIQSALATQLQELSVQFRKAQKDYLQRTFIYYLFFSPNPSRIKRKTTKGKNVFYRWTFFY